MIEVNIKGVLYGIAAALPYMQQQQAGHVINVSSVYAATKFALRALSEGPRKEVKPYNIRTTIISPGAVATELPNSITEADVSARIHDFYSICLAPLWRIGAKFFTAEIFYWFPKTGSAKSWECWFPR